MTPKEHSVSFRYAIKFMATILSGAASLIILFIAPRLLGPASYGVFSYTTSVFSQIIGFLESATSMAFFVRLSGDNHNKQLIGFYQLIVTVTFVLLVGFIFLSETFSFHQKLFPNIEINYVWFGLFFSFTVWLNQIIIGISDAHALTVYGGVIRSVLSTIMLVFFLLVLTHHLNLKTYFWFQNINQAGIFLAVIGMLILKKVLTFEVFYWKKIPWGQYVREFFVYCKPLYSYNVIAILTAIFDFWLLQYFSGLVQQGYYGFAFQIATLCSVLSGTMISIFMREVSKAHAIGDWERLGRFFQHYTRLLYILTALGSIFLMFNAREIAVLVGGEKYTPAVWVVALAMLYPLHQILGQINGAMFYAMGRTEAYRNIGLCTMVPGMVVSWILLVAHDYGGFHLGALGLVIKMLLIQFLGVNIQLKCLSTWLNQPYKKYLWMQIVSLIFVILFAGLNHWVWSLFLTNLIFLRFIAEAISYGCLLGVVILYLVKVKKIKFFLN